MYCIEMIRVYFNMTRRTIEHNTQVRYEVYTTICLPALLGDVARRRRVLQGPEGGGTASATSWGAAAPSSRWPAPRSPASPWPPPPPGGRPAACRRRTSAGATARCSLAPAQYRSKGICLVFLWYWRVNRVPGGKRHARGALPTRPSPWVSTLTSQNRNAVRPTLLLGDKTR